MCRIIELFKKKGGDGYSINYKNRLLTGLSEFILRDFMTQWTVEVKWSESFSVLSDSLWPHGLHSPWNSPGQNTRVGSLSILQLAIFPTEGWNPGLPHCRRILYQLSHEGSPRILEWVAYPVSSGSSQMCCSPWGPKSWTWLKNWTTTTLVWTQTKI